MKLRLLVAAGALALVSTAAMAGDPFDDARYYMGIKKNEDALKLIDSGQFDINTQTDEGYSLLHYAADNGNLEMVRALLQRGADPTLKSARGSTPYDMAMTTTIKVLLAKAHAQDTRARAGASADDIGKAASAPATVAVGGSNKGNGMCAAVRAERVNDGRSPALRPLLKARDAIWYNQPEELAALLEDCVDANAKDGGTTLLHIAAERDRLDAAKILLQHGASRSARDEDGNNPAAYAQSPEMRALLGPATTTATKAKGAAAKGDRKDCEQKFQADAALSSDSSGKARAYRRWQQCLKTGLYW
jgi:hypothetical protein